MSWKIIETLEPGALTDYELMKIYSLLCHQKNNGYQEIAAKLQKVAEHAMHNTKHIQNWENEGGQCDAQNSH
jgi:hypothetical protein